MTDDVVNPKGRYSEHFDLNDILSVSWQFFSKNIFFFIAVSFLNHFLVFSIKSLFGLDSTNLYSSSFLINVLFQISLLLIIFNFSYKKLNNEFVSWSSLFSESLQTTLPFFLIILVYIIASVAGLALLILPGIFLMAAFAFAPLAYLSKKSNILHSFSYSLSLIKNRWVFTLLITILLISITLIISIIENSIGKFLPENKLITDILYASADTFMGFVYTAWVVTFINYDKTNINNNKTKEIV